MLDCQPLLWLDTSPHGWWEEGGEGEGKDNLGEALALTSITNELLERGVQQSMIGVISPYWAQVRFLHAWKHPHIVTTPAHSTFTPEMQTR